MARILSGVHRFFRIVHSYSSSSSKKSSSSSPIGRGKRSLTDYVLLWYLCYLCVKVSDFLVFFERGDFSADKLLESLAFNACVAALDSSLNFEENT